MQSRYFEQVFSHLEFGENRYTARFNGYVLESVFQPIFSLFHHRSGGSEALVRGVSPEGVPVSAFEVLSLAGGSNENRVFLDRLLRTLHIANVSLVPREKQWIFLNLDPFAAVSGRLFGSFFESLLSHFSIRPYQVVVEILESGIEDEKVLYESVQYYRKIGCLLAIDDFGAGHSNFDRIWSLRPDIVKVDRSMITGAAENGRIRRLIPGVVSLLRESGALVVLEGVETKEEARVVFETEADFVQGFYFSHPRQVFPGPLPLPQERVIEMLDPADPVEKNPELIHKIGECLLSLPTRRSLSELDRVVSNEMGCPGAVRFYVLDARGFQRGETVTFDQPGHFCDFRFDPLSDARGANWSRRGYFKNAMKRPGRVQISRPYLSITGAHLCRTLSIALEFASEILVFCVDIDWSDHP